MDDKNYYYLIVFATVSILASIILYFRLYTKHKDDLSHLKIEQQVSSLVSYVYSSTPSPKTQIISGLMLFVGVSSLLGTIIADAFFPDEKSVGAYLSFAAFLFSILVAWISILTLWETRRISHAQGYSILDFHNLIVALNKELEEFLADYQDNHKRNANRNHRVFLVTSNPFLGSLSYPEAKTTSRFNELLNQVAKEFYLSNKDTKSGSQSFRFGIICSNEDSIGNFHRNFYSSNEVTKIREANASYSHELTKLIKEATHDNERILPPIFQKVGIPSSQFMVIGRKLFLFTFSAADGMSQVINTDVSENSKLADAYVQTFELLRDNMK